MMYCAVWSLKRGAIDPPERLDTEGLACVNAAIRAERFQVDVPISTETLWRLQGLADGFIKRTTRRHTEAA